MSTEQQEAVKRQRRATVMAAPPPPAEEQPTAAAHGEPPRVACLFQVPAGLPREPSPGAMHACRIAAWAHADAAADHASTTFGAVLASGGQVFWSSLRLPQTGPGSALQLEQHGKEGVLLPLRLHAPAVSQLQQLPAHAGEVQALALSTSCSTHQQGTMLLATVDAFGAGSISRVQPCWEYAAGVDHDDSQQEDATATFTAVAPVSPPEVTVHFRLQPVDTCREGGWAGVCFSRSSSTAGGAPDSSSSSSTEPALLATARSFAKDLTVYDVATAKPVRSFATVLNPYALTFLPAGACGSGSSEGSLLALTEGHLVSVWDVRASGAGGGCVQRCAPSPTTSQPLYTLAWCPSATEKRNGLIGAAGAERSLFMVEPRKWQMLSKWTGATRLAIHSLSFLEADPRCAVLAGLDLEVLIGRWDRPGSNFRPFTSTGEAGAAGHRPGGGGSSTGAADAAASSSSPAQTAAAAAQGSGDDDAVALPAGAGAAGTSPGLFSFRGDGRWLGVSKAVGSDVLAGFAASGNLVYARVC